MADEFQSRAKLPRGDANESSWIVLFLDGSDANQFRLWMGILAVLWETRRRRAGPVEREMFACIRNFAAGHAEIDEEMMIDHCKELVLRLGGLYDPRRNCPHYRNQRERSRY